MKTRNPKPGTRNQGPVETTDLFGNEEAETRNGGPYANPRSYHTQFRTDRRHRSRSKLPSGAFVAPATE